MLSRILDMQKGQNNPSKSSPNQNNFKRKTVTSRASAIVLCMALVCVAVLSVFAWYFYRNSTINFNAQRAGYLAAGFASAVDPALFQISAMGQTPDEYAILLQEQVTNLIDSLDGNVARVFVVMPYSTNQFRYFAYAARTGTSFNSDFGNIVPAATWGPHIGYALDAQRLRDVFYDTSPYVIQGVGNVIPAFAPILGDNNQVLGLVAVNFDISAALREANIFSGILALVGIAAAILLWQTLRWVLSRALSYSLKRIVSADYTFGKDSQVFKARDEDAESSDEIALLYANFADIYKSFDMLIKDLHILSEEHVNGFYSDRLDESKYRGGHKELAKSVNAMIDMYVDDTVEILKVVQEYGKGNFDVQIREYPGDWVWANHAMMHLQNTFKNLVIEISKLAEAFNKGDFDVIANSTGTEGQWYSVIEGLNEIAYTVSTPITEIKNVMNRLGDEGLLDKRIEGDYHGEFLVIKNVVNSTMDGLTEVIQDVASTLEAVASGDLTKQTTGEYPGDFNTIKESLDNIGSTLNKTIHEINLAASQVLSGASQISEGSAKLAIGSNEQAASVEELNSSLDIISLQTQKNADNAEEANILSDRSASNAQKGNGAMEQLLDAMDQIKESSSDISRIIKVIQDIAFQTNLLALNATVEAARAGEHGKGFAVVAEEVRNLASRSQTAATETTDLIEDSISRVSAGSGIAQSTSEALNSIVTSAEDVLDIINGISTSSRDQAESISQLSNGLNLISEVVQSNSAISQETAAAAEELNSQAELLRELVAYFRV